VPAGGTTTVFSQDFLSFPSEQAGALASYALSAWIYPQAPASTDSWNATGATERIEFLHGGTRGCGPENGGGIYF
jgi:hypothetical protein